MELSTPLETICRLIVRAREMEAQVPAEQTEADDDPSDSDDEFAVLEDEAGSEVVEEITALLEDLGDDQLQEVLALAWVGRGTYDASEWTDALEEAADPDQESPVEQLLDMPTLAAFLDNGLAAFDLSCSGIGQID